MSLPNPAVLISTIAGQLQDHLKAQNIDNALFVGIHTGGVWVANQLLKELKHEGPLGILNVSFIAMISAAVVYTRKCARLSCPLTLKIST